MQLWQTAYYKAETALANKGLYSQSYVFFSSHVRMWNLDHKESQGIDALELWCWRRLLRAPWTARKSNQSILKEVNPGYSLEGLKLLNFGHLMQRANSLEKTLMLGKLRAGGEGNNRGWDGWMASPTQGHEFEQTLGKSEGQGTLACCSPWSCKELDVPEQQQQQRCEGKTMKVRQEGSLGRVVSWAGCFGRVYSTKCPFHYHFCLSIGFPPPKAGEGDMTKTAAVRNRWWPCPCV